MTIFPRYVSSRFKDLRVGISSYSEDRTALEVIGNVGVGTTNPDVAVGTGNTAKLAVGVATANNIYAKQYFGDENNNFNALGAGSGQVGIDSGATLNILMGRGTGKLLTSGQRNILMGLSSGCDMTTASSNIGLGYNTLRHITTGGSNIAIGQKAGRELTTGSSNIYLGNSAGQSNTSGRRNVAIGDGVDSFGFNYHCGCVNVFIGAESARANYFSGLKDTFVGNTFLGYRSGWGAFACCGGFNFPTSTFGCNTVIGHCAGTLFGATPLSGYSDIIENVYIGAKSATFNLGGCNVLLGSYVNVRSGPNPVAGFGITASVGNLNIGIGHSVCLAKQIGNRQLAIGHSDFQWIHGDSNYNVGIGITDPSNAVTSTDTQKLAAGIVTAYNVFASQYRGDQNNNFYAGAFVGSGAAGITSGATLNIGIGQSSGFNLSTGKENILLGSCVGIALSTGSRNVLMGCRAGVNLIASDSILIGDRAGCDLLISGGNIGIGRQVFEGKIGGGSNIAIGAEAGREDNHIVTCSNVLNISIGSQAGRTLAAGRCNINIGYKAGENNFSATGVCSNSDNVYIGTRAGNGVGYLNYQGCDISCNVAIGHRAGESMNYGPSNAANQNVLVGHYAFHQGRGACNIFIGPFAGWGHGGFHHCSKTHPQLYGDRNIGIGHSVTMPSDFGSNQLAIGQTSQYWITGDPLFNVGIGSTQPQGRLDVEGRFIVNDSNSENHSSVTGSGRLIVTPNRTFFNNSICSFGNVTIGEANGTRGNGKQFSIEGDSRQFLILRSTGQTIFTINDSNSQVHTPTAFLGGHLGVTGVSTFQNTINVGALLGSSGIGVTITGFGGSGQASFSGIVTAGQLNVDGNTSFGGNVSIAGTLTYEDVTNVDSIGIITAGHGLRVTKGGINVTAGISTFGGNIDANAGLEVDGQGTFHSDLVLQADNKFFRIQNNAGFNQFLIDSDNGDTAIGGVLDVTRTSILRNNLNVAGVSTFAGAIDANGTLDVDGQTSLDDVLITGFTTFFPTGGTKFLTTIEAENGMFVHNSGVSTFKTPVQIDAGATLNQLNVSGVSTFVGILTATHIFADRYHGDQNNNFYAGPFTGTGAAGIASGANSNIGIGNSALIAISSGEKNIAFGCKSGRQLTTARHNILMGAASGCSITTGDDNVFLGFVAGRHISTGCSNVAIGDNAFRLQSTAAGTQAGYSKYNTVVGARAGQFGFTGDCNIAIGFAAGFISSVKSDCGGYDSICNNANIFLGTNAGAHNQGAARIFGNILIGDSAGGYRSFSDSGNVRENINIGHRSGLYALGCCNIYIGSHSATNVCNATLCHHGSNNIGIGNSIQMADRFGSDQLAIGHTSQYWITGDSSFNVGIGSTVPQGKLDVGGTIFADQLNVSGVSTFVGILTATNIFADRYHGDENNNFYAGPFVGSSSTESTLNIGIGQSTGTNLTTGNNNVLLGDCVGAGLTTGQFNVFLGAEAGRQTVGNCNVLIGRSAGCDIQTAGCSSNIGIGCRVFMGERGGYNNIAIGGQAGRSFSAGTASNSINISIGLFAGRTGLTTSVGNISIGCRAGEGIISCNTNNDHNIMIGEFAGQGSGGCCINTNIMIGCRSGMTLRNGPSNKVENNVLIGTCAFTTGQGACNIFLGAYAACGYSPDNSEHYGDANIGIGHSVKMPNRFGSNQLAIGQTSQYWITGDESFNVGIGSTTPQSKLDVGGTITAVKYQGDIDRNIVMGRCAGIAITPASTEACHNVILGDRSGERLLGGDSNVFIGCEAGIGVTDSSNNIFIGKEAGAKNCSCYSCGNIAIGHKALCHSPSNTNAIAIGCCAGYFHSTAHLVAIGCMAGKCSPNPGIYIGTKAGENAGAGSHVLIGVNAGKSHGNAGGYNVMVGNNSGCGNRCGCSNVFLGGGSAQGNYDGSCNIAIGRCSGPYTVNEGNGSFNFSGGWRTGSCILTGNSNVFIGVSAGVGYTSGSNNISIGTTVGPQTCGASGNYNIAFGHATGNSITSGSDNISIGRSTGSNITCGGNNVLLGRCTGFSQTNSYSNVYIGDCVARLLRSGGGNIGIGRRTFDCVQTGVNNIAMGYRAGRNRYSSDLNHPDPDYGISIGYNAGDTHFRGNSRRNIFMGFHAGDGLTQGISTSTTCNNNNDNIFIGSNTGDFSVVCGNYCRNIIIGDRAAASHQGAGIGTDFVNSVLIGTLAGFRYKGSCNIFLGAYAGCSPGGITPQSTGIANIGIGLSVQMPDRFGSNQLAIGQTSQYWIVGDQNFNVGIGTTIPTNRVTCDNTQKLAVGVVTSHRVFTQLLSFSTGSETGGNFTGANIAIGNTFTGNTFDTTSCLGNYRNISIGECTGCQLDNNNNILIGYRVGNAITKGRNNIVMGREVLSRTVSGLGSVTGRDNLILMDSASLLTSGSYNVILGDENANSLTTGGCNIVVGKNAGSGYTDGYRNIILGHYAGAYFGTPYTNGCDNIFIGSCANSTTTPVSNCLVIGNLNASWIYGDNNYNVGIGITNPSTVNVGVANTQKLAAGIVTAHNVFANRYQGDENRNFFAGEFAGTTGTFNNTGANLNIAIGNSAGTNLTGNGIQDAEDNVLIGTCAGIAMTTSRSNVIIGAKAGISVSGHYATANTLLGYSAGQDIRGDNNIAIGNISLHQVCTTTSNNNIGIGLKAGRQQGYKKSVYNVSVGALAGDNNVGGCCNVYVGVFAGRNTGTGPNDEGCGNTMLGHDAGSQVTDVTNFCNNVLLGVRAGYFTKGLGITTSFARNVIIGSCAGVLSKGSCNIYIGPEAAHTDVFTGGSFCNIGDSNIGIGQSITMPDRLGSNQLAIGQTTQYWITGDQNFNVGIGSTTPQAKLDVVGGATLDNLNVIGVGTFLRVDASRIFLPDNHKAQFGNVAGNADLEIYHDGNHNIFDANNGFVKFYNNVFQVYNQGGNNIAFEVVPGTYTKLFHGTTQRLITTSSGVDISDDLNVSGIVTATDLNISGVGTFANQLFVGGLEVTGGATIGQDITTRHLKAIGISTFVGDAEFNGNVSVGGTLTYEDVTNIDSVGIVTARKDVHVGAGLSVVGVSTFNSRIDALNRIDIGSTSSTGRIRFHNGTSHVFTVGNIGGNLTLRSANGGVKADDNIGRNLFFGSPGGAFNIYHSGNNKLQTTSTGVNVTGNVVSDGLVVDGHSELDDVNVSGITTTNNLNVSGVGTFNGRVGVNTDILRSVPALDVNLPQDFSGQNLSYSGEGGVGLINRGNKTFPNASGFRTTLGLKQDIEIGGTQTIDSSSPGGFPQVHGMYNFLIKNKGNVQNVERLQFIGFYNQLQWLDQNTLRQYRGIEDHLYYNGADANGKTSSFFEAGVISLTPEDGKTQTISNVIGKRTTLRAASGIATVTIGQTWKGHQTQLSIAAGSGRTTNAVINNAVFYNTSDNWGTSGSGTKNATIQNLYGLKLNPPSAADGLVINNNYGIYQGWSNASNYFAGNVGVGTTIATNAVSIGNTAKLAVGIATAHQVFAQIFSGTSGYATGGPFIGMNVAIGNTSTGNTLDTTLPTNNHSNISIGECTGCSLANTCNVLIGHRTGVNLTSGKRNVYIGPSVGGNSPQTGNDNIIFGNGGGFSLTSGGRNIIMGDNTTYSLSTGNCNILLGSMVAGDVSSGSENVIIGVRGAHQAGNGSKNVFLGACARPSASGASNCLIIANALNDRWIIGDSNYNVGIGITDPSNAVTSSDTQKLAVGILTAHNVFASRYQGDENRNFFAGEFAGSTGTFNNTAACLNVAIGNSAGSNLNASGSLVAQKNIYIGSCAGFAATTSCYNTVLGADAGIGMTNHVSNSNVLIGFCAGRCVTGSKNVALGPKSLDGTGCKSSNIGIGDRAGRNYGGSFNVSMGILAGDMQMVGCKNTSLGYSAGRNILGSDDTVGLCNVFVGNDAFNTAYAAGPFTQNTVVGNRAGWRAEGLGITTALSYNVFLGSHAGCYAKGSCNIFLGPYAAASCFGQSKHEGMSNIGIGQSIQMPNRFGSNQLAIGQTSQYWIVGDQSFNVGIGTTIPTNKVTAGTNKKLAVGIVTAHHVFANRYHGDQSNNFYVGPEVGSGTTGIAGGARLNVGIGVSALTNITSGVGNVGVGWRAGKKITSGTSNILIGGAAGCCLETATQNIGFGGNALRFITTGKENTAVGHQSMRLFSSSLVGTDAQTSCHNTALGYFAGSINMTGDCNVWLGYFAGQGMQNSCGTTCRNRANIAIGPYAGRDHYANNIFGNIFIGDGAGRDYGNANFASVENIHIGYNAAQQGTGLCNVYIGPRAAFNHGGSSNIGIGQCIKMPKRTGNNQLAIGQTSQYWITGDENFNVGIGTTIPTNKVNAGNTQRLSVGIVSAYQISASFFSAGCNNGFGGNIAIGNSYTGNVISTDTGHSRAIAFGNNAGCQDTGHNNVIIGDQAAKNLGFGDDNIIVGGCAMGKQAGIITGSNNIMMGEDIAENFAFGYGNILFGGDSAYFMTCGRDNIAMGCKSLSHLIEGTNNIALGRQAGQMSSGSPGGTPAGIGTDNIFLGSYATAPHRTPNKYLVIGHGNNFGGFDEDTNWIIGDPNYNIGIGIGTPTSKLHVKGDSIVTGVVTATSFVGALPIANDANNRVITATGSGGLNAENNVTYDGNTFLVGAEFLTLTGTGYKQLTAATTTNNSVSIKLQNSAKNFNITNVTGGTFQIAEAGVARIQIVNGNVSVPNSDLNVSGVVTATDFDATSDIRLKTNIKPIDDPIAKVIQIEGVSFNWKKDNQPALGVIADQVEKILPELVHGDDPKTVNYNGLIGLLIEVVKDQQKQINTLSERISKLE